MYRGYFSFLCPCSIDIFFQRLCLLDGRGRGCLNQTRNQNQTAGDRLEARGDTEIGRQSTGRRKDKITGTGATSGFFSRLSVFSHAVGFIWAREGVLMVGFWQSKYYGSRFHVHQIL